MQATLADQPNTAGLADMLRQACGDLPLPLGAKLAFVEITNASPDRLPAVAENWAPIRRNSFAAGRAAAAAALTTAGFDGAATLGMDKDGLPDWPPGWRGSISHAGEIAAAVVAPTAEGSMVLGLDVEQMIQPQTAVEIASTIMPDETLGRSGLSLPAEITRVFSAKEALYKALFPQTRQFRGFEAAQIDWPATGAGDRLELVLTEDWGGDWHSGSRLVAFQVSAADHVVTVVWR